MPSLSRSPTRVPRVWVVEVAGRATVAYPAEHNRQAQELLKEAWFMDDLLSLKSNGTPLWDGKSPLKVRLGSPAEIVEFNEAKPDGDDLTLVFLVPLDGIP